MPTSSWIASSCPQAADITITEVSLELDGGKVHFYNDQFGNVAAAPRVAWSTTTYLGLPRTCLSLSQFPVHSGSVQVFLSSGAQRPVTDFVVLGDVVILLFTPNDADTFIVHYMAYDNVVDTRAVSVGTMFPFQGADAPDGWLLMDGVDHDLLRVDYAAFTVWMAANMPAYIADGADANHFIVGKLTSTMINGAMAFVQVNLIIKA